MSEAATGTGPPRKKLGRPSNIDRMDGPSMDALLAAEASLKKAWADMVFLRKRHVAGAVNPLLVTATELAACALRDARHLGLTWRQCGDAMGLHYASAHGWWKRHGSGQADWKNGVEDD